MSIKTTPWKASDYLNSHEEIEAYLQSSIEDTLEMGDSRIFKSALQDVVKAKKISVIAKKSELSRESLYKALNPESHARFDTINKVINALGFKIKIEPI